MSAVESRDSLSLLILTPARGGSSDPVRAAGFRGASCFRSCHAEVEPPRGLRVTCGIL